MSKTFDGDGRPQTMTDGNAKVSTLIYNDSTDQVICIDPLGHSSRTFGDLLGRTGESINPLGLAALTIWSPMDDAIRQLDPQTELATGSSYATSPGRRKSGASRGRPRLAASRSRR